MAFIAEDNASRKITGPAFERQKRINISDKTVRNQLAVVYSKLNVAGQLELAVKAAQLGLVSTEG